MEGEKKRKLFERCVKRRNRLRFLKDLEEFKGSEKIKNKKLDKLKKIPTFAVPTKRELSGGCRKADKTRLKR